MTYTEERPDDEQAESASHSEEKTDREDGGPTSPDEPQGEPAGAPGTKPTEGFDPHE